VGGAPEVSTQYCSFQMLHDVRKGVGSIFLQRLVLAAADFPLQQVRCALVILNHAAEVRDVEILAGGLLKFCADCLVFRIEFFRNVGVGATPQLAHESAGLAVIVDHVLREVAHRLRGALLPCQFAELDFGLIADRGLTHEQLVLRVRMICGGLRGFESGRIR
jgi:hypothetical protein